MRTLLVITFITALAGVAEAQQVTGYGVAGPAGAIGFVNTRSLTFHAGGGAEVFLGKYFAVGGEGGANAWNIGAGGDAWLSKHAGIRFELRDHIRLDTRGDTHYWSVRAGVALR